MSAGTDHYLDGNAAAGELNQVFAIEVTTAEGQCANCGVKNRFAETHLYMQAPGLVARCPVCEHVLLRLANVRQRVVLDVRGMTYFSFDTGQSLGTICDLSASDLDSNTPGRSPA